MSEKRIPSKVVSALLRLERAGDEHSRTTQRLCDAAWLVADLLRQRVPEGVEIDTRTALGVSRAGVAVYEPCQEDPNERSWWKGNIATHGDPTPPSREMALILAAAVADGWLDELTAAMAARVTADREATAVLDAAAERLQPDIDSSSAQRIAVSPTPGSLGFTAEEILAAMDEQPRPPALRERGVYLLPCGGEAIASRRFKSGEPAGWLLYTPSQWHAEAPPAYRIALDGSVSGPGYECAWNAAGLVDTGRTVDPETDRLAD